MLECAACGQPGAGYALETDEFGNAGEYYHLYCLITERLSAGDSCMQQSAGRIRYPSIPQQSETPLRYVRVSPSQARKRIPTTLRHLPRKKSLL